MFQMGVFYSSIQERKFFTFTRLIKIGSLNSGVNFNFNREPKYFETDSIDFNEQIICLLTLKKLAPIICSISINTKVYTDS
jgi:hypothetical protein